MIEQSARGSIWSIASGLLGFIYVTAWSTSFWPQTIANWKRESTSGTSIDFPIANLLGFTAYTVYTAGFLYSLLIQEEYAKRHPSSTESTVSPWDFAFALHGWVVILILLAQFWWYKSDKTEDTAGQRPSVWMLSICGTAVLVVIIAVAFAIGDDGANEAVGLLEWIDVLYVISQIKLVLTLVKYVPQVLLNMRRQSTKGWKISTIIFDATGSIASTLQLILDSVVERENKLWYEGITGNPVKLLLGGCSLCFDFIFMYQHFILYRDGKRDLEDLDKLDREPSEGQALLSNRR